MKDASGWIPVQEQLRSNNRNERESTGSLQGDEHWSGQACDVQRSSLECGETGVRFRQGVEIRDEPKFSPDELSDLDW